MDEEGEEEEDVRFRAGEVRIRAAQLQKELDEQNKFDCLCDGKMNDLMKTLLNLMTN